MRNKIHVDDTVALGALLLELVKAGLTFEVHQQAGAGPAYWLVILTGGY